MASEEWLWESATEIGRRIAAGELSSRQVTDALLARATRLDESLHAYLTLDAEGAQLSATQADAEIALGRSRGPLHGVPIAVKDLVDTAGLRTSAGLRVLWDRVPERDAAIVTRLREAGAVILGKLSMSEGALGLHHPTIPPPVNPWDPMRWTGISSSGSAVATAARLCFASLGSDTGGSIRVPAACCGVVGFKPSYGRVPLDGVFPLAASLDHVGPMTRDVGDAAAMLAAIGGFHQGDPRSSRAPIPDYLGELSQGIDGARIGVDENFCSDGMSADVVDRVLSTRGPFERAGAIFRSVTVPPVEPLLSAWNTIAPAEAAAAYAGQPADHAAGYGPALAQFLSVGSQLSSADVALADTARQQFSAQLAELFKEVDLLLSPALGIPVPAREPEWLQDPAINLNLLLRFTAPFNCSGNPAITLPAGLGSDGMPVGVQLVGRHLEESLLLRAGQTLQDELAWQDQRPSLEQS